MFVTKNYFNGFKCRTCCCYFFGRCVSCSITSNSDFNDHIIVHIRYILIYGRKHVELMNRVCTCINLKGPHKVGLLPNFVQIE